MNFDNLANQDEVAARIFERHTNVAHSEDTLESVIAAKLGIPVETDDNLDADGQPIRERAEDPTQGTGNVIGTPGYNDPLLGALRQAGVI